MEKQLTSAQAELAAREKTINQLSGNLQSAQTAGNLLQKDLETATKELKQLKGQQEKLIEEELESLYEKLENATKTLEAENNEHLSLTTQLETLKRELETRPTISQQEYENLEKQNADFKKQVNELVASMQEKEEKLAALMAEGQAFLQPPSAPSVPLQTLVPPVSPTNSAKDPLQKKQSPWYLRSGQPAVSTTALASSLVLLYQLKKEVESFRSKNPSLKGTGTFFKALRQYCKENDTEFKSRLAATSLLLCISTAVTCSSVWNSFFAQ